MASDHEAVAVAIEPVDFDHSLEWVDQRGGSSHFASACGVVFVSKSLLVCYLNERLFVALPLFVALEQLGVDEILGSTGRKLVARLRHFADEANLDRAQVTFSSHFVAAFYRRLSSAASGVVLKSSTAPTDSALKSAN